MLFRSKGINIKGIVRTSTVYVTGPIIGNVITEVSISLWWLHSPINFEPTVLGKTNLKEKRFTTIPVLKLLGFETLQPQSYSITPLVFCSGRTPGSLTLVHFSFGKLRVWFQKRMKSLRSLGFVYKHQIISMLNKCRICKKCQIAEHHCCLKE